MKEGRIILVSRPCSVVDKKTHELLPYDEIPKEGTFDTIICQTYHPTLPYPKEDEILYKMDDGTNRGYLLKIRPKSIRETFEDNKPYEQTNSEKIQLVTCSLNSLLQAKNKNYGSSALEPLGIFNKNNSTEGIKVRLDDKLMRVKNSDTLRKNDIADIMGYLVLLCVSENWLNFDDLID